MKNRIYPTWDEIEKLHNPLTEGERTLARFLDNTLTQEWDIFVQPYLNGRRPDIIVFNQDVGVIIYEVKDSDLSSCSKKNGKLQVKKAVKQVGQFKEKIIDIVPDLGEEMDKNKLAFGLVKTALYFHNTQGKILRKFFNKPFPKLIGYDDLVGSNLRNILPFSKEAVRHFKSTPIRD